jgi:hypothetical protein
LDELEREENQTEPVILTEDDWQEWNGEDEDVVDVPKKHGKWE